MRSLQAAVWLNTFFSFLKDTKITRLRFAKLQGMQYFCFMESDFVWDPLRKKSVRNTPEEQVRQWFISVLHEGMKVPEHMMGSEVSLSHAGKDYRADIVVYDRSASPVMVVECKRPEVELGQEVVDQALRYNNELDVKYIAITNGHKTFMFERVEDGFSFMEKAPLWEDMI